MKDVLDTWKELGLEPFLNVANMKLSTLCLKTNQKEIYFGEGNQNYDGFGTLYDTEKKKFYEGYFKNG